MRESEVLEQTDHLDGTRVQVTCTKRDLKEGFLLKIIKTVLALEECIIANGTCRLSKEYRQIMQIYNIVCILFLDFCLIGKKKSGARSGKHVNTFSRKENHFSCAAVQKTKL